MLVDDHPLMLRGLDALLSSHAEMRVVAQLSDATAVRDELRRVRPDVVVLDLVMPGQNGFDTLALLAEERPAPPVVILSMLSDIAYVRHALRLGAMGYVLKDAADTELIKAVQCAARGEVYLGAAFANAQAPTANEAWPALETDALYGLTPRERQILQLVADGFTNSQIADGLTIGVRTVETHRANLMRKLKLRNHGELIRFALARKLTAP